MAPNDRENTINGEDAMFFSPIVLAASLTLAPPAAPQQPLESGLEGAIQGCEEWVLNPASWTDGIEPFMENVALGDRMGLVDSIPESAQPPRNLRVANHYWRINATKDAGYFLVVSDHVPMCHITGGGEVDLQPTVAALMSSADFSRNWQLVDEFSDDGMLTSKFSHRQEPSLIMTLSRSDQSKTSAARPQLVVTAKIDLRG
ncbi:hypothetical protein [Altericroceibacterium endophyticum]|uniref:Uncharacterized protein n=1 Tax=Altericroceibacterium endophyticum TaxID=1808508 RepID=A0A6I4T2C3_9SPHN|nr:hypothetical protein [Altericroceibacterium endophyticum]MXO64253.1 hypothetical protein [Altericroceibacterium endophyticum]